MSVNVSVSVSDWARVLVNKQPGPQLLLPPICMDAKNYVKAWWFRLRQECVPCGSQRKRLINLCFLLLFILLSPTRCISSFWYGMIVYFALIPAPNSPCCWFSDFPHLYHQNWLEEWSLEIISPFFNEISLFDYHDGMARFFKCSFRSFFLF